jgi:hypothetical protein
VAPDCNQVALDDMLVVLDCLLATSQFLLVASARFLVAPTFFSAARSSVAPDPFSEAPDRFSVAPARFSVAPARFLEAPARFSETPARFLEAPARFSVAPACFSVAPAHVLDHCSILNPWQLVLWGCMLMGSLMAWHHRVAEPLCSLQRREHGMHVTLTLLALCSMLPSTQARDVPGLYSVQHVPSHRRELQTTVSNSASLTSALANTAVGHIVLAPGTYYLSAELSITRSVILEAAVAGSVVLHAQASFSIQRRVLLIDPGSSGVVQLIKLNITGGNFGWVSSVYTSAQIFKTSHCPDGKIVDMLA